MARTAVAAVAHAGVCRLSTCRRTQAHPVAVERAHTLAKAMRMCGTTAATGAEIMRGGTTRIPIVMKRRGRRASSTRASSPFCKWDDDDDKSCARGISV